MNFTKIKNTIAVLDEVTYFIQKENTIIVGFKNLQETTVTFDNAEEAEKAFAYLYTILPGEEKE